MVTDFRGRDLFPRGPGTGVSTEIELPISISGLEPDDEIGAGADAFFTSMAGKPFDDTFE